MRRGEEKRRNHASTLSLSLQEGDLEVLLNMGTKTDPDVEEECKTNCAITDWSILVLFVFFVAFHL